MTREAVGGTALLSFIPKLPRHPSTSSVAQQALTPASTQAQTRHQQHKPESRGSSWMLGKARGLPRGAAWSYWWGSSPSQGSRGDRGSDCDSPGPARTLGPCSSPVRVEGACGLLRASPAKQWSPTRNFPSSPAEPSTARTVPGEEQDQICEEPPRGYHPTHYHSLTLSLNPNSLLRECECEPTPRCTSHPLPTPHL